LGLGQWASHWDWVLAGRAFVGLSWVSGLVCCRLQFYLILSLLLFARKEKIKREKWPEAFPKADTS
jgi:hypothetical protein